MYFNLTIGTLEIAFEKMINHKVERLLVVNDDNQLIGLITKQSIIERLFKYLKE